MRPNSYVRKIETGRERTRDRREVLRARTRRVFQRAKAVVVCANGAETPRLLLNSKSNLFPNGLANSSGVVGKHLMFNGAGLRQRRVRARGERIQGTRRDAHRVGSCTSSIASSACRRRRLRFPLRRDADRSSRRTRLARQMRRGGAKSSRNGSRTTTRARCFASDTRRRCPSRRTASRSIPTVKDAWGVPAIRMTYQDHPQDLKLYKYFAERGEEMLKAAGAVQTLAGDGREPEVQRAPARHVPHGQ